jgi:electron transport complex protein RnfC
VSARRIHDFHGGIHPPENKQQSVRTAIAVAGIPPELVLPLSQHSGAPATPVVQVGERVLKGQVIAGPAGLVSAPVHAPTSGTVSAIEERLVAHPSGHLARCVVLASDGRDEWVDHGGTADYRQLDREELIARIRGAGIAGMGGAGFPAAVKLSVPPGRRIDTLILNGTECEPYITADDMLMRERADRVVEGAKILRHLLQPGEALIGVEDNKPESAAALRQAVQGSGIEVVEFPTKYPSGGEKQLIEILTGRQVPSGGLPADVGVICHNVGSAVAIRDAVLLGRPLISRITTVTGTAVREPQNFEVLLGTPVSFLLKQAGYRPEVNRRLIMGGPMMGFALPSPEVPVVKTTNCILAPGERELPLPPPPQACIRCGMCEQACPASLLPQQLFWFAQGREYEKLEQHNLFDCIECGACSWVCPSHIPLVQYYRASKAQVLQLRRDHDRAEHSRERFEARQARLAREEAEKEARRAARKQAAEARARQSAAGSSGTAGDPVQAAIERAKARKAALQSGDGPAGEAGELEKLEKAVVTTRRRLQTATAKLEAARADESELVDALQLGVDKTRAKLEAAERALHEYRQAASPGAESAPPEEAARAAIERAITARAAEAALDPDQRRRNEISRLEERLQKSRARLAQGRELGEEEKIIDALESTVARLEQKLAAAQEQRETARCP